MTSPTKLLTFLDSVFINCIRFAIPVFFCIAGWWGPYIFNLDMILCLLIALACFFIGISFISLFRKLVQINIDEIPVSILIFYFLIYSFLCHTLLMGIPILIIFVGMLAGHHWVTKIIRKKTHSESIDFEIFRVSLFTAVMIGLFSLLSSFYIVFNIHISPILDQLIISTNQIEKPILVMLLICCSAVISLMQFLATKLLMYYEVKSYKKQHQLF